MKALSLSIDFSLEERTWHLGQRTSVTQIKEYIKREKISQKKKIIINMSTLEKSPLLPYTEQDGPCRRQDCQKKLRRAKRWSFFSAFAVLAMFLMFSHCDKRHHGESKVNRTKGGVYV